MNEKLTQPATRSPRSWGTVLFMLIFCTFWSGITLWFDSMLVTGLVRQINAQATYKTATATITRSEVVTDRSSEGDTHAPAIEYTYSVDGHEYAGARYSYFEMKSGGKRARRIAQQYPPGREASVHYDPDRPELSALTVGVDPLQLYMLIFLTPFNVIMLTMCWVGVQMIRNPQPKPLGGKLISDDGFQAVVRVSWITPLTAGVVTLAAVTFVLVFVLGLGFSLDPPMPAAAGAVALASAAAIFATARQSRAIATGRCDLRIDRSLNQVTLPRRHDEREPRQVRFKDVVDVATDIEAGETPTYSLRIVTQRDGPIVLEKHLDYNTAEMLRDWLREQVAHGRQRARAETVTQDVV